jgi:hypothetical protein
MEMLKHGVEEAGTHLSPVHRDHVAQKGKIVPATLKLVAARYHFDSAHPSHRKVIGIRAILPPTSFNQRGHVSFTPCRGNVVGDRCPDAPIEGSCADGPWRLPSQFHHQMADIEADRS